MPITRSTAARHCRDLARPALRTVTTATGMQLGYDKLLLTTGSTPRHLNVPGG
jgi:NAD(P)H-nitrite reductase large subunit